MSDRYFILVLHYNFLNINKVKHLLATYDCSFTNYIYFSYFWPFSIGMKRFFYLFSQSPVGDKRVFFTLPFATRWKLPACSFLTEDLPQGIALSRSLSSSSPSCANPGPCLLVLISNFCYKQMPLGHSWTCLTFWFPHSSFWPLWILLTFLRVKLCLQVNILSSKGFWWQYLWFGLPYSRRTIM